VVVYLPSKAKYNIQYCGKKKKERERWRARRKGRKEGSSTID
jgi:hypothetical protein